MNEEKFTGKAENYDKYRPSYPRELLEWLYAKTGAAAVADIGAGTGKLTALLTEKPWAVTAVEPNEDMARLLKKNAPKARVVATSAENTGLESGAFGLVTAAQCFHWFDEALFKAECQRLLADNGRVAIIWYHSISCDLYRARGEVFAKYCASYAPHMGRRSSEEGDSFLRHEYFSEVEVYTAENSVRMDEERFIGECLSRSYALKPGDEGFDAFVDALREVFAEYRQDGCVVLPQETQCYLGKF